MRIKRVIFSTKGGQVQFSLNCYSIRGKKLLLVKIDEVGKQIIKLDIL